MAGAGRDVLSVMRELVPGVKLFAALIYAFGALGVAVFLFSFHVRAGHFSEALKGRGSGVVATGARTG